MSDSIIVEGGQPLHGTVRVSGAKNAALPLIAATLLSSGRCTIKNVPDLTDIHGLLDILREVGLEASWKGPGTLATQVKSETSS